MGDFAYGHEPVMAARVTDLLVPALTAPAVMVDATLGRAGHARRLLQACPGLTLIGIDADEAAIAAGQELAAQFPGRVTAGARLLRRDRRDRRRRRVPPRSDGVAVRPRRVLAAARRHRARASAYAQDAPLDMRMDQPAARPPPTSSTPIRPPTSRGSCFEYGEERFARRIADAIIRERAPAPDNDHAAAGAASSGTRSRRRPGAPAATRPSAPSRRCASR